jgi:hypothetical protein
MDNFKKAARLLANAGILKLSVPSPTLLGDVIGRYPPQSEQTAADRLGPLTQEARAKTMPSLFRYERSSLSRKEEFDRL